MTQDVNVTLSRIIENYVLPLGFRMIGAVALWIVGGWVIGFISKLVNRGMEHRKLEPTLTRYTTSTIQVVLRIVLVIAILSVFGIETTSFCVIVN